MSVSITLSGKVNAKHQVMLPLANPNDTPTSLYTVELLLFSGEDNMQAGVLTVEVPDSSTFDQYAIGQTVALSGTVG